jgi:hypothetical protein
VKVWFHVESCALKIFGKLLCWLPDKFHLNYWTLLKPLLRPNKEFLWLSSRFIIIPYKLIKPDAHPLSFFTCKYQIFHVNTCHYE